MKRLLLPLLAAITLPTAVNAEISDKVHERCKDAKDYIGCVTAQTGKYNVQEIITNPGTATAKGNTCPVGYAYIGEGYCREVLCISNYLGNEPIVAGKKWLCRGGFALSIGGDRTRIGFDPKCPKGEPEIGWSSTCESPYKEPPKKDRTQGRK